MAKQIYIEKQENIHSTIRRIGRAGEESSDPKKKKVRFLSTAKELLLFKEDSYIIKFVNSMFETNNQKDIDFIRKHPAYNKTIFEGKYPADVLRKIKDDKKYIELVEDAFSSAEA